MDEILQTWEAGSRLLGARFPHASRCHGRKQKDQTNTGASHLYSRYCLYQPVWNTCVTTCGRDTINDTKCAPHSLRGRPQNMAQCMVHSVCCIAMETARTPNMAPCLWGFKGLFCHRAAGTMVGVIVQKRTWWRKRAQNTTCHLKSNSSNDAS